MEFVQHLTIVHAWMDGMALTVTLPFATTTVITTPPAAGQILVVARLDTRVFSAVGSIVLP